MLIKFVGITASVAAIYTLLGLLGMQLAIDPGNVTPVWPPSGFALASILLFGRKALPGIGLGAFAVNTITMGTDAALVSVGISAGSMAQPLLGAVLIGWFIGADKLTDNLRNFLIFAMVVPAMCLVSATVGTTSLLLGGYTTVERLNELWITWWLGDGVGILILTPFLMAWRHGSDQPWSASSSRTLGAAFVLLTLSALLSFGVIFDASPDYHFEFLTLPFLLWIALQFNLRALTTGILLLAGIAIWQTAEGNGPYRLGAPNTSLLMLQLFLSVSAITAMVVAALTKERRSAEDALRIARDELEDQVDRRTTELKEEIAERERVEAQLLRSQRLEAVGQLTGGVAHDFNNLLAALMGNAELLERLDLTKEETKSRLEAIKKVVGRGASLTNRLLAFSRQQTLKPQSVNIARLVDDLDDMLRRTLGETIELRFEHAPDLWLANIDPHQVEHALINLAVNARDAMPKGGILTIETANAGLDEDYTKKFDEAIPGEYAMIAVSDTGVGMASEIVERAFEPFFTTKDVGKGSGLGLSMVYGFAKQSKGHVAIYSEVDRGTTVKLYLPRSSGGAARENLKRVFPSLPRGRGRILVVEDDPYVRDVSAKLLRSQGYDVAEAENGAEAIEHLSGGAPFDCLFTDVVLPGGMDGVEIGEKAEILQPDIKILYTSGYTENTVTHNGRLVPGVTLISKPFRQVELLEKIHSVLSGENVSSAAG